ncbi:hypothetical protein [Bacteroides congonensis]|uniref:hypothetical protein n=1 Tax=Bacteroides congonensis TaxID=1871006 RepID=UPI00321BA009
MIIKFLNELKSDSLEKKYELESRIKSLKTKINENKIFIQRLKSEAEQNFNAFSPRKQNVNLKKSIEEREIVNESLLEEYHQLDDELNNLNSKLEELDQILIFTKKESLQLKQLNQIKDGLHIKLHNIIYKLEFCSKIVLQDASRCRLELLDAIQLLNELMKELSSENDETH